MLYSYNSFTSLLEGKNRDKKINKQKQKINKFLKFEPMIDYIMDKVVDNENSDTPTRGLQYTIWFADRMKKDFIEACVEDNMFKNNSVTIDGKRKGELKDDDIREIVDDFLTKKTDKYSKRIAFNKLIESKWKRTRYDSLIGPIVDWLKSPIREEEQVDLSQFKSLEDAFNRAEEWHENIKATGVIINEEGTVLLTFDDGWYWIDLETNSDEEEASAMGHCGTTSYGDTLYSLRRKQSPHVTAAIGTDDGAVFQMKGRENKKPIEKYHKYILELLKYPKVGDWVTIQNDFEPISYFSTEEYLPTEDFHISDLTGEQIVEIKNSNPALFNNAGIGVRYKLFKENVITVEELCAGYDDLHVHNGEPHFVVSDWLDFSCTIFQENRDYRKGWQCEVLDGTYIENFNYDTLEFDYTYEWNKVEERALQELLNVCTHQGYEICYDLGDEQDCFMMSSDNCELSPNKDDIWIKTPIGGVISFESLLSARNGSTLIDTKEGKIDFYSDALDDIRDMMDRAYTSAQELADEGEAYETVTNAILDKVGKVIKNPNGKSWWWYKEDGTVDGLHIDLNWEWISEINDSLTDSYSNIIDMINDISTIEAYDNQFLIDCDPPYNGWDGSIDKSTLSEEIINKLYDV